MKVSSNCPLLAHNSLFITPIMLIAASRLAVLQRLRPSSTFSWRIQLNKYYACSVLSGSYSSLYRQSSNTTNDQNHHAERKTIASSVPSSLTSSNDNTVPLDNSSSGDKSINSDIIFKRLLDIAKPERNLILASAGTLFVTSSITLVLPWACGHVLDTAILEATTAGE